MCKPLIKSKLLHQGIKASLISFQVIANILTAQVMLVAGDHRVEYLPRSILKLVRQF